MSKEIVVAKKKRSAMGSLILMATVASGVIAAYLMYKRGESLPTIARRAITNPVGSLFSEVRNAV